MYLNNRRGKFIAHRGLSSEAPENTMAAFKLAAENQYYGIECDVQTTMDHQFVVFHDQSLERMTKTKGKVRDLNLDDVLQLTIKSGKNIKYYDNLKIPTLEQYLQLCEFNKIIPFIEVKYVHQLTDLDHLVNVLKGYGFQKKGYIISLDLDYLIYLRNNYPTLKLQYVVNVIDRLVIGICKQYDFDVDVNYGKVSEGQIEVCHNNGLKVNVWTVDSARVARRLLNYGVDYITTNKLK